MSVTNLHQDAASPVAPSLDGFKRLREPFPPEMVGKLPKSTKKDNPKGKCLARRDGGTAPDWQDHFCGGWHGLPAVHLDYVGHGAVTDRLLEVDPGWTWEPVAGWTEDGQPKCVKDAQGKPVGLGIFLTVLGVTRPGYGTVEPGASDAVKQLIGDALRNAALRFGVALDLWIKGEKVEGDGDTAQHPDDVDSKWWGGWASREELDVFHEPVLAEYRTLGVEQQQTVKEWLTERGYTKPPLEKAHFDEFRAVVSAAKATGEPFT